MRLTQRISPVQVGIPSKVVKLENCRSSALGQPTIPFLVTGQAFAMRFHGRLGYGRPGNKCYASAISTYSAKYFCLQRLWGI